MSTPERVVGYLKSLLRYPVKSMQGEQLQEGVLTNRGLLGDRVYALIDAQDGTVVSAKNPRKWPGMFHLSATYSDSPRSDEEHGPISITGPNDLAITSDKSDIDSHLSSLLGRAVRLTTVASSRPMIEQYWPILEEGEEADKITQEFLPPGTFYDVAPLHLLSTRTLGQLASVAPESQFEVCRFRPNLVVELTPEAEAEADWVGRTVRIGEVRIQIVKPCERCVMTTLPQGGLPGDTRILQTIVRHFSSRVGVYATTYQEGEIRVGDAVMVG